VISGAKVVLPELDAIFIVETLLSVRKESQFTSTLLVCSVVIVLLSFMCAGFVVLPPIHRNTKNMKISVAIGLIICSWIVFKFLVKLEKTMVKVMASSLMFRHNDMEETRRGERGF
jgi:amino acid permease